MYFYPYENTQSHIDESGKKHAQAYMIAGMIEVGNGGRVLKTPVRWWPWTG